MDTQPTKKTVCPQRIMPVLSWDHFGTEVARNFSYVYQSIHYRDTKYVNIRH